MKAVVFEQFGEPGEVLQSPRRTDPEPGPGEVRVRMIASPVNPSDLLVVRGRYGVLPTLPSTPGFEGVGVVEQAGPGLLGKLVKGKRVTVINGGGELGRVRGDPREAGRGRSPADIADEQVASYFVNPATVLAMVQHVLNVPQGGVAPPVGGRLGAREDGHPLGKAEGIRTLNVVRRHEAIEELKPLGGDVVISSADGPIEEQVRSLTGGEGVRVRDRPGRRRHRHGGLRLARGRRPDARLRHALRRAAPDRPASDDRRQAGGRGVLARPLDARTEHPSALSCSGRSPRRSGPESSPPRSPPGSRSTTSARRFGRRRRRAREEDPPDDRNATEAARGRINHPAMSQRIRGSLFGCPKPGRNRRISGKFPEFSRPGSIASLQFSWRSRRGL